MPSLLLAFTVFACLRHPRTYDTRGDTTAPHTGRTPDAAEGATALALSRLFSVGPFRYAAPLSLPSLLVCLPVFFLVPRDSVFIPEFEERFSVFGFRHFDSPA